MAQGAIVALGAMLLLSASVLAAAPTPAAAPAARAKAEPAPPRLIEAASPATSPSEIPQIERRALGQPSHQSPTTRPVASDRTSSTAWVLQTLAALGVVIALILLLRAVFSRWSGRTVASSRCAAIEVLARVTVAPRSHVLLLRLGRRIVVVGESASGLRTLADVTDPEEVAALLATVSASKPQSVSQGFAQLFRKFNGQYPQDGDLAEEGADDAEHTLDSARDEVSSLLGRIRSTGGQGGKP